ncbi:MAG: hypothetical protein CSA05_01645 [Bacteroidia bacterium]|nr:MAG: hypothetical protein CSA05_01645 [Bacteroidia bacterium]
MKFSEISGLQFFQLFRFVSLVFVSILFAKSSLELNAIGNYEIFLFIASSLSFFWISGVIQSLLSLFPAKKEAEGEINNNILFNAFLLLLFFSLLSAFVLLLFEGYISSYLNHSNSIPYLSLLAVYILLSGPSNLVEYIYLLLRKPKRIVAYALISYTIHVLFLGIPVFVGLGIRAALYGLLAVTFLRFIWTFREVCRHSQLTFSFSFFRTHFKLAYPLILSALLAGSAQYIDGVIITAKFDASRFAVFRYGAKELPFVSLLANAFSNAMLPEIANNRNRLEHVLAKVKNKSKKLIVLLFPISIALLLLSSLLYPLVFSKDFAESALIFDIYLLLILSRLVFPQTLLIAFKETQTILFVSLVELMLNVGLSLILVNYFGIVGVAYATVVAYVFEKIILIKIILIKFKIKPSAYIPLSQLFFWNLTIILVFLAKMQL